VLRKNKPTIWTGEKPRIWVKISGSKDPIDDFLSWEVWIQEGYGEGPNGEDLREEVINKFKESFPNAKGSGEPFLVPEESEKIDPDIAILEAELAIRKPKARSQVVVIGSEGKDGQRGRDGLDGQRGLRGERGERGEKGDPGRDINATDTYLEDLRNVERKIEIDRGQVLTWDGSVWTNQYPPDGGCGGGGGKGGSKFPDAPDDGCIYGRQDGKWVIISCPDDCEGVYDGGDFVTGVALENAFTGIYDGGDFVTGIDLSTTDCLIDAGNFGATDCSSIYDGGSFLTGISSAEGDAPLDGGNFASGFSSSLNLCVADGGIFSDVSSLCASIYDGGNFNTGIFNGENSNYLDGGDFTAGLTYSLDTCEADGGDFSIDVDCVTIYDGGNYTTNTYIGENDATIDGGNYTTGISVSITECNAEGYDFEGGDCYETYDAGDFNSGASLALANSISDGGDFVNGVSLWIENCDLNGGKFESQAPAERRSIEIETPSEDGEYVLSFDKETEEWSLVNVENSQMVKQLLETVIQLSDRLQVLENREAIVTEED